MSQFIKETVELDTTPALTFAEYIRCADHPGTVAGLRRAIYLLLKSHYMRPEDFSEEYAHLRCFKYVPDGSGTLTVGMEGDYTPGKTDNLPGVFVGTGGLKFTKDSMGNTLGSSHDNATRHLEQTATATITIDHVAKNPTLAADMAEMSIVLFMAMAPVLRNKLHLRGFDILGFPKPAKLQQDPEPFYNAQLSIAATFTWASDLYIGSHRIKKFTVATAL